MHPFLLDCLIYFRIAVHNMFLKSFVFPRVGSDLFFLIHDFINLFKEPTPGSVDLFHISSGLDFLEFCSNFN